MAGINGLRALFTSKQVGEFVDNFIERKQNQILQTLRFMGETFVNKARLSGNYQDRTGNLRSSIGYIILNNGEIVEKNFEGNNEGVDKGNEIAATVALNYPKGFVLIGVAGMEYAAYVEAKNYDVISGSAPQRNEVKSILDEIKL